MEATGYCRPSVSTSPASSTSSSDMSMNREYKSEIYYDTNNQPISDAELAKLSVRQLNMRLQGHDRETVSIIKQKRRTLKNRGYALNCRLRRIQNQIALEAECVSLRDQVRYLSQMVNELHSRLQYYEAAPALIPQPAPIQTLLPTEIPIVQQPITQVDAYTPIEVNDQALMTNAVPIQRVSLNTAPVGFYAMTHQNINSA